MYFAALILIGKQEFCIDKTFKTVLFLKYVIKIKYYYLTGNLEAWTLLDP